MNIGFIGEGRVAKAFSQLLKNKNICVMGFHTRTNPNFQMLDKCDMVFIATPDDQIPIVAKQLTSSAKFFCHFSGALSSAVLLPLKKKGVTIASLHPAMTFTESTDLSDVIYTFEGDGDGLDILLKFFDNLGINRVCISAEAKPLYHAAMCNVSNHITTLIYMTIQMLKKLQIDEKNIFPIISPLAKAALDNSLQIGPEAALTGPISRGDINTIKTHIPFVDDTYIALAKKTVDLAYAAEKIDINKANEFKEALNNASNNK